MTPPAAFVPPPEPTFHADELAFAMFGEHPAPDVIAAIASAPPPRADEPVKKKKRPRGKKGFWDPDSPFLPREKK
jgi:hypothetical protein